MESDISNVSERSPTQSDVLERSPTQSDVSERSPMGLSSPYRPEGRQMAAGKIQQQVHRARAREPEPETSSIANSSQVTAKETEGDSDSQQQPRVVSYFEFVFSVVPGNFQIFYLLLNLVPLFYYYFRTQLFIYLFSFKKYVWSQA